MNTDEALTEQIARVLNDEGWTYEGVHEPGDYDTCGDCKRAVDPVAAAVLPVIRKAQADAWEWGRRDVMAYIASGNLNGDEHHAEPTNRYRTRESR